MVIKKYKKFTHNSVYNFIECCSSYTRKTKHKTLLVVCENFRQLINASDYVKKVYEEYEFESEEFKIEKSNSPYKGITFSNKNEIRFETISEIKSILPYDIDDVIICENVVITDELNYYLEIISK